MPSSRKNQKERVSYKQKLKLWVNKEVAKELDKDPFSSLPLRIRVGIFLIIGASIFSYLVSFILGFFHIQQGDILRGIITGAGAFAVGWVMRISGFFLAGKSVIKYPIYFLAKFLFKLFPKFFNSKPV